MHDQPADLLFGPFRLRPGSRQLLRGGVPVEIGGRALDLLIVLATQPGVVLAKRRIMETVWPNTLVEDGSLRFHMANLRRLLGDGQDDARYISTQVGVGYAFVAPVRSEAPAETGLPKRLEESSADMGPARLPTRSQLIGREQEVESLTAALAEAGLYTLAGTGGVGKTSLAVEVGHRVHADGQPATFVDLAQLEDGRLVPSAIAAALGIEVQADDAMQVLLGHIRRQENLIVLDNCEHLIDAVSGIAERIRDEAPRATILATSREPLRARDEQVHWLGPLAFPPAESEGDPKRYPAMQLFLRRAMAANAGLILDDADIELAAEICRRLEGMALPIELAAARSATHGISATHAALGERLSLAWSGRRTALPRQQTLQATLDWSYDLLAPEEQRTLERISVFVGPFGLTAAIQVAASSDLDPSAAAWALDALVVKGLVVVDRSRDSDSYRLLEMTRAYGKLKLIGQNPDQAEQVARRHALYFLTRLSELGPSPEKAMLEASRMARQLGNVRAALDWSFGPHGDIDLAIPLVAASLPLLLYLSLLSECRAWCARATETMTHRFAGTKVDMEIRAALGLVLMFTRGNTEDAGTALRQALDIANELGDHWSELRLIGRLHIYHERIGELATAMDYADRAVGIAQRLKQPEAIAVAASLAGISHQLAGDQQAARKELETALSYFEPSARERTLAYGFDHRNRSGIALARTLWLQGLADQARSWVEVTLNEAAALDHPVTRCIALIWALSVHLWTGDREHARTALAEFTERSDRNAFGPYIAAASGLHAILELDEGKPGGAVVAIQESLARLHAMRYELLTTTLEIALVEGMMASDRDAEAAAILAATIRRCEETAEGFALPELLRLDARLRDRAGAPRREVEAGYQEAISRADQQGSTAWALRAALNLADHRLERGDTVGATTALTPFVHTLTEGADTTDIVRLSQFLGAENRIVGS